jgi:hypothetical protein
MAINLHAGQSEIYEDLFIHKTCRFSVNCCSRGFGKSYFAGTAAATAIFELMELPAHVPNKNVYIIAPTYDQVTDIYYPLLAYDLGLEDYAIKSSRDMGRFWFPGNVELRLLSYESVERMRGKGAYFVVWDEVSSCKKGITPKEAWQGVIQPCIITRWSGARAKAYGAKNPGRALIISTPKGYNYFHEMFTYQDTDDRWKSYHFDYTTSPFLDQDEIESLKHTLDPVEWASEYLASFAESGNNVFYMFKRELHVKKDLADFDLPDIENGEYGEDVHVCIDFNVGIQASCALAIRGKEVHILEEFKGHSDTETLAIALKTRFAGHRIFAYPDPSGRARKTSAPVGRTDFSILESHGIKCLAHSKAPAIVDSVAAVNRKLQTASGAVTMYVHPRCKGVITSLERTKWVDRNQDTATIDKSEGIEHFSDGIRYFMEFKFPVLSGTKRVSTGFNF